jgi:hypothetical protein
MNPGFYLYSKSPGSDWKIERELPNPLTDAYVEEIARQDPGRRWAVFHVTLEWEVDIEETDL